MAARVGQRVLVEGAGEGTLQFVGSIAGTERYGVELDAPNGRNDGSAKGKRYFQCAPEHGIFTTKAKISLVEPMMVGSGEESPSSRSRAEIANFDRSAGAKAESGANTKPKSSIPLAKEAGGMIGSSLNPTIEGASTAPVAIAKKEARKLKSPMNSAVSGLSVASDSAPHAVKSNSERPLEEGDVLRGNDLEISLEKEIGEGSFAKVFQATEKETGLVVAAKIFNEGEVDEEGHAQRMALAQHEYDVVGFLTHDNIVRVHGLLFTNTTVAILQELVTEGDLFGAVVEGIGISSDHVMQVMRGIGSALRYLHDEAVGMVHLDVKPENVLLSDKGVPKLCDFDTAMKIGAEPFTMRGTPEYQSPESIPGCMEYYALISSTDSGGYPLHPGIDVWAFGLVVYFVMFGAYAWGQAIGEDPAYDAFDEGRHLEISPWKYMPASIILFFNRALDGRREHRATVVELLQFANEIDYATEITYMRECMKKEEVPSDEETVAIRKLNQSGTWIIEVEPGKAGASQQPQYRILVTPPRESDTGGRVDILATFKRLLSLHKMSEIQCAPPSSGNPMFTRPIPLFPPKKLFGTKASTVVRQRCVDLAKYFRIAFVANEVADFWYNKFLEMSAWEREAGIGRD